MSTPLHVAVFPLPKIVAFPGHSLQFHIFEPRYRKMVRDCEENGLWVGVAQGELVKKARTGQTLEEFLNSNQETYAPSLVFGAGPMRVLKELPDGRYVIEVEIRKRVRASERVQELPYVVMEVEPLADESVPPETQGRLMADLKSEIGRIAALRTGLLKHLQSKEYFDDTNLSTLVYSILKWFVIENREGQGILEDGSPSGRAEKLLSWMRYFVREASVHVVRQEAKSSPPPKGRKDKASPPAHGKDGHEAESGEYGEGFLNEPTGGRVIPVDFRHRNAHPDS
jgi:Lon protease-like protein